MSDIKEIKEKNEPFDEALIILEVPHRRPPMAWMAVDRKNFIDAVARTFESCGDTPTDNDFEAWAEYNGHDLSRQYIMSCAEALQHIEKRREYHWMLLDALIKWGFVDTLEEK